MVCQMKYNKLHYLFLNLFNQPHKKRSVVKKFWAQLNIHVETLRKIGGYIDCTQQLIKIALAIIIKNNFLINKTLVFERESQIT